MITTAKMGRYVVVMAGGAGTRFWPASRRAHPKQFLSLAADRPLIAQTMARVDVPWANRFVVTGAAHAEHARQALPDLPSSNLLVEPVGRNTAPCIAWATKVIGQRDPDARIAVLPSDHYIQDTLDFRRHLDAAFGHAGGRIVLFGIVPTRPETGYGYIKKGPVADDGPPQDGGMPIWSIARFVEKPDRETAEQYLREGDYLWNSGMFVFSARTMLEELERYLPTLTEGLEALLKKPDAIEAIYPRLPKESIDYGVMEKSDRTSVLPASFPWSDVGSWDSAMTLYEADEQKNVLLGDAVVSGTTGSMVDARGKRLVAVVGLDGVMVVDTKDAVLVVKRGRSEQVKEVVSILAEQGREELL